MGEKKLNSINDCYTLNNGVKIPCVGFGTYKASEGKDDGTIRMAIEAGYRYIDTASFYENEEAVGNAVRESGIARDEFFIVSKAWKSELGYENIKAACERSLKRLKTDHIDLYLLHWPLPDEEGADWKALDLESWRAMEELYKEGKVRAIGVSNYHPHHLLNILENASVVPAADQIEFHPGYPQEATVQFCQERDILVQAWSPLGRMRMTQDPQMQEIAARYGVTPAQICLRYAVQRHVVPIPKSSSMERMKQNQDLFGFEISREDMWRLTCLPMLGWSGEHPERPRVRVVETMEGYDW